MMSSAPPSETTNGAFKKLFSFISKRKQKPARIRLDKETRRTLEAPAQLFIWQDDGTSNEGITYPSLREAIRQAPDDTDSRSFIVAENGHILRPFQIAKIKKHLAENV
ncbi:hypothetical protein WJT86_04090 [Microvirga sp. W0021]|uniref:Uncharacterized protein n=1 Tax=Hohaiivirga grylli TaxID=3133970 RepID=A0ABV0BJ07_9HYPH